MISAFSFIFYRKTALLIFEEKEGIKSVGKKKYFGKSRVLAQKAIASENTMVLSIKLLKLKERIKSVEQKTYFRKIKRANKGFNQEFHTSLYSII